jgi:squalene synthase HpnC
LAFQGGAAGLVSVVTYGLMVLSFGPILETYRLSPLYALSLPITALCYLGFTVQSAVNHYRGRGGYWKGRVQAGATGTSGDSPGESGKNASTENFPVASWLIAPEYRSAIHAYYRFARAADDVADDPRMSAADKLARLDALAAALVPMGQERLGGDLAIEAGRHQVTLAHAHDLLQAFRLDVTKTRYHDWDDLIAYCQKSAMPVGRFVLDVHGEDPATHGPSDALCAALQVINHLQDCGDDLREIDRVYIPEPYLAAQGETIEALRRGQCSAGLRRVIDDLLDRTDALLVQSSALAPMVKDWRLRLEIAIIQTVAERLVGELRRRDPLSERVKLSRQDYALYALQGMLHGLQASGTNR